MTKSRQKPLQDGTKILVLHYGVGFNSHASSGTKFPRIVKMFGLQNFGWSRNSKNWTEIGPEIENSKIIGKIF